MELKELIKNTSFSSQALKNYLKLNGLNYQSLVLPFKMQLQQQTNWCWAAIAVSISSAYNSDSTWTQCLVACKELRKNDCCNNSDGCNQLGYLETALSITGNFINYGDPLSFEDVQAQIEQRKFIGVRIGWPDGMGGHFVAIYGCNIVDTIPFLNIGDPQIGTLIVAYNEFRNNYQLKGGTWTHTFFTKSDKNMNINFLQFNDSAFSSVKKIRSLIEMNNSKDGKFNIVEGFNLTAPHEIYTIDLSLFINRNELKTVLIGYRILEAKGSEFVAIYDFTDIKNEATFHQVITDMRYLIAFQSAMNLILSKQDDLNTEYSLCLLKIPELHLEFFWLKDREKKETDKFIPILNSIFFTKDIFCSKKNFINRLKKAAKKKILSADKLIGG